MQPESIKLDFSKFYYRQPQIASYKPSGSHVRKIVLKVKLPHLFEGPLLDFSCVPEANIRVTFYLGVEYKMHIPVSTNSHGTQYRTILIWLFYHLFLQAAWQSLKAKLPAVFAEGLDNYDVARPSRDDVIITRPTLGEIEAGWKPSNAVHLEGEPEAREEAESMVEHYRYRAQMNTFYWR